MDDRCGRGDGDAALTGGMPSRASEQQVGRSRREAIGGDGRHLGPMAARGANDAGTPPLRDQNGDWIPSRVGEQWRMSHQQGKRDIKDIDLGPASDLDPQTEQDLGDDERCPDLLMDEGWLGTPEQMQVQVPLEELVGQFHIPAPGIEYRDRMQRQEQGIAHIGDKALGGRAPRDGDEAHGMARPIRAICPQPDQLIGDAVLVVEGVDRRPAGPRSQSAEPVVPSIGEIIEPGKAEVAQIRPG